MKKTLIALCGAIVLAALIMPIPLTADDKKPAGEPPKMSAEEAKAMEAFMKLAAPGEHHGHLKAFAGKWNCAGKFRMSADAPWTESKSESNAEWILGGRFLQQTVKGDPIMPMPTPFEGVGLIGYDNGSKKYVYAWADTMGTMLMTGEGTCDNGGKTITFTSTMPDPTTGKPTTVKTIYKSEGPSKYVLSMVSPGADGKDFTCMEVTHTRK